MDEKIVSKICCPGCRGDLRNYQQAQAAHNSEDRLICQKCKVFYPIIEGIPILIKESGNRPDWYRSIMDDIAEKYINHSDGQLMDCVSRHHYVPVMRKKVDKFCKRFLPADYICDLGVGWGWHWKDIARPNILGVDYSLPGLLIAKRILSSTLNKNVHLICADAANLPIKAASIDGIWSVQMMQHLPPDKLELVWQEIKRIRKGTMIEIYWNNYSGINRLAYGLLGREYKKLSTQPFYYRRMDLKEMRSMLEKVFGKEGRVITLSLNEALFQKDLRLMPGIDLSAVDELISSIPVINEYLCRQIVATIEDGSLKHKLPGIARK